jgi:hypothetical protein
MRRSYYLLFVIFTLFLSQSCKKDTDGLEPKPTKEESFLDSRQFLFEGEVSGAPVFWRYGVHEFQTAHSGSNPENNEQGQKSMSFSLTSNNDLTTQFEISTPLYTATSDELFAKLLVAGEKEIGSGSGEFKLRVTLNNIVYTTDGDQTNSQLKILKVEKAKDEANRNIALVWFKVNCNFYNSVDGTISILKDGYVLAGFMYDL